MEIKERLKTIPLFEEFKNDDTVLQKIADIIKREKFSENTFIIREGEMGNKMYILNKGTVRVEKKTPANDKFTVANLREDMNIAFGELALIDNDLRSASVFSVTHTDCYVVTKEDFEKLSNEYPTIGYHIMKEIAKSLSSRLRKANFDNVSLIEALIQEDGDLF